MISFSSRIPSITPRLAVAKTIDPASPTRRLNRGPPKHAETAACAIPRLATVTSETKSPTLIPHANTVAPSKDSLTPQMRPMAPNSGTSSPAAASIHVTDWTNVIAVSAFIALSETERSAMTAGQAR